MDSTPPPMTSWSQPARTFCAAMLTASRPDAQNRLICTPPTVSGSPARIAAVLAMSAPWSPIGVTTPRTMSSMRFGSRSGCRRRSSSMSPTTSEMGLTPCSEPDFLPRPRGVLIASYMKASVLTKRGPLVLQRAGDKLFHDFIRAGVDLLHATVGVHPGYRVLDHITVATEKLQAAVDDLTLPVGEPVFGHRRGGDVELAAQVLRDAVVQENA